MASATGPVTFQYRCADERVLPVFGSAAAISVDRLCLSNLPHAHLLRHPLCPPVNLRRYVWVEGWRTSNVYLTSCVERMKLKGLFWVCISCSHSWSRWSTSKAWEKDARWPRFWGGPGGFGKRQWVLHAHPHSHSRAHFVAGTRDGPKYLQVNNHNLYVCLFTFFVHILSPNH